MAYSRWGRNSDWYVFWEDTEAAADAAAGGQHKPKPEERLAIWHAKSKETPSFTYVEICQMLVSDDFSPIPGFTEESRVLLRDCMSQFVQDVDHDNGGGP
jgi:hypothetical protein